MVAQQIASSLLCPAACVTGCGNLKPTQLAGSSSCDFAIRRSDRLRCPVLNGCVFCYCMIRPLCQRNRSPDTKPETTNTVHTPSTWPSRPRPPPHAGAPPRAAGSRLLPSPSSRLPPPQLATPPARITKQETEPRPLAAARRLTSRRTKPRAARRPQQALGGTTPGPASRAG